MDVEILTTAIEEGIDKHRKELGLSAAHTDLLELLGHAIADTFTYGPQRLDAVIARHYPSITPAEFGELVKRLELIR